MKYLLNKILDSIPKPSHLSGEIYLFRPLPNNNSDDSWFKIFVPKEIKIFPKIEYRQQSLDFYFYILTAFISNNL